jgi:hypothetical protein
VIIAQNEKIVKNIRKNSTYEAIMLVYSLEKS